MPETALFNDDSRTADISACSRYRYRLTRRWGVGPTAGFLMLNPSTADATIDDPTIRRCIGFAKGWDCGALVVVNLFALRSTDPAALAQDADPIGPANDDAIAAAADQCCDLIAAWGAHQFSRARAAAVERRLFAAGQKLWCFGTTKEGHPRHPLYVPGATRLVEFNARQPPPSPSRERA